MGWAQGGMGLRVVRHMRTLSLEGECQAHGDIKSEDGSSGTAGNSDWGC